MGKPTKRFEPFPSQQSSKRRWRVFSFVPSIRPSLTFSWWNFLILLNFLIFFFFPLQSTLLHVCTCSHILSYRLPVALLVGLEFGGVLSYASLVVSNITFRRLISCTICQPVVRQVGLPVRPFFISNVDLFLYGESFQQRLVQRNSTGCNLIIFLLIQPSLNKLLTLQLAEAFYFLLFPHLQNCEREKNCHYFYWKSILNFMY